MYVVVTALVIGLGLASRHYRPILPDFIGRYAGDTLWATALFLMIAAITPTWSLARTALWSGLFASVIEASQLYRAPWLENLRQAPMAGLVLGYDFLWSDLLCYAAGIAIGCVVVQPLVWADPHRAGLED